MKSLFTRIFKSGDLGLAVRRFFVFAAPVLVLGLAIGGNFVMSALQPKPEEKEEEIKATPVVAVAAEQETVRLTVMTQGEASPRTEINLAPYVSGQISFVSPKFIEGGAFKKDEVLLSIEDAEYQLRVTQARSSVAQARSRYASEKAESESARKDFEELGIGEGSELALRKPQMAEAAAMLASAKAALGEAELQLARTKIIAPFDGRIAEKNVDIGEFVSPGTPLGQIFSTGVMEVRLPLTDSELGQLGLSIGYGENDAQGPSVKLSAIVAGVPRNWQGRIVRTDSRFDSKTRVLFAYTEVEDPYGVGADNGAPLAAGLFVSAEIEGRIIDDAVVVPRSAIRGEGLVYVVRPDSTMEVREVSVAKSDRDRAVLTAGLTPGERVIISPVTGAADGISVVVAGDAPLSDETRIAGAKD